MGGGLVPEAQRSAQGRGPPRTGHTRKVPSLALCGEERVAAEVHGPSGGRRRVNGGSGPNLGVLRHAANDESAVVMACHVYHICVSCQPHRRC
jgi:hypothetical protein